MKSAVRASLSVLGCIGALASAPPVLAQQPAAFIEGDMVKGGRPLAGGPSCVLASQFQRGELVVWRIRVTDAATGQPLDDKGLKSVHVALPDGQKFEAKFGPHPKGKPTDNFWAVSWDIPASYPTGSFSYTVTAVDVKGRSTTWQPFKVAPSQLAITP